MSTKDIRIGLVALALQTLFVLTACSAVAGPQSLEVFAQSGMSLAQGDSSGITYTFLFDEDGLLHSFKEVGSTGIVIRSFDVGKEGGDIVPVYAKNDLPNWIERLHISSDSISLKTSKMAVSDILEVRTAQAPQGGGSVLEHVYNGTVSVIFEFGVQENRLKYPARGQTFKYTLSKGARALSVVATAADPDMFEIVRKSGVQYEVTVKASDGLVLAKYRIKGTTRKCDPLIAIANFELITGGPDLSPVLYPFVGGSPE